MSVLITHQNNEVGRKLLEVIDVYGTDYVNGFTGVYVLNFQTH